MGPNKLTSTNKSEESLKNQSYREKHEKICPYLSPIYKNKNNVTVETKSEQVLKQLYLPRQKKKTPRKRRPAQRVLKSNLQQVIDYKDTVNSNQKLNCGDAGSDKNDFLGVDFEKEEVYSVECDLKIDNEEEKNKKKQPLGLRANQHEYLQFLLRITEDIIMNNYFKNEDIVQVFQYHIEVNRDRLDMEKMYKHLRTLSSELNVVYKPCEDYKFNDEDLHPYSDFSASSTSIHNPQYESDCECSVKRVLSVDGIGIDSFNGLLLSKRSLDKLTEYTEPSNSVSIETLCYSSKLTSVSSSGSIQTTVGTERIGTVSECCIQTNFDENVKIVKSEGDLVVNRTNSLNYIDPPCYDILTVNIDDERSIKLNKEENIGDNPKILDLYTPMLDLEIELNNSKKSSDDTITTVIPEIHSKISLDTLENSSENSKVDLATKDQFDPNNDTTTENENNIVIETPSTVVEHVILKSDEGTSTKKDQSTQITINYCDKDCNTNEDVVANNIKEDDDYILVNGPVYILKKVFNLEKTVILSNPVQSEVDYAPVKDTNKTTSAEVDNNSEMSTTRSFTASQTSLTEVPKLIRGRTFVKETFNTCNISDYSLGSETVLNPMYLEDNKYYRLLHSDYDITPQRDTEIDKYHYLLVDASTSSPNLELNGKEEQSLLKSDYYAIENTQNDEKFVKLQ